MNGKNLTRTLSSLLIFGFLFTLLFSIGAFALEPSGATEGTEYDGEAVTGAPDVLPGEAEETPTSESLETSGTENVSIFEKAYEALAAKAPEITSILAFIGSLIIVFSYKKGFLPLVSEGIKALASGVKSVSEKTEALEYGSEEFKNKISEKIEAAETILTRVETSLAELEKALASRESEQKERAELKSVLLAETEMLYEVFMSAALPQYLKDSVGEKMAGVRRLAKEIYADEN